MLRRLHSRIIGFGSVCGLPPSPPAEVFLKSLPPPSEVDPAKYSRFQREERGRADGPFHGTPEPFYSIATGAAGHKHVALLTHEGHLITFGENRHGQTAAPKTDEDAPHRREVGAAGFGAVLPPASLTGENPDWAPLFVDLGDVFGSTPPHSPSSAASPARPAAASVLVSCGANFTVVYQPGGRRAIAFGNNHVGQLGVGHKNRVDGGRGFEVWNPLASWWPAQRESVLASIVSGYNHSVVQLTCGSLYGFGSNTWGELSIGTTVSPMLPTRIRALAERGAKVRKVAAGNSFTLFLTEEGRVYGCGATAFGQLPANSFDPVPVPLVRSFVDGEAAAPSSSSLHRLIRIKDVACVGSMAVYVSVGNEILVQGSLPEYGVATYAPRLTLVDQAPAIAALKQRMLELGWRAEDVEGAKADGFVIRDIVTGPSTLLVRFQNGCVGAMGANAEGQLHNVTKCVKGRAVNLAPSFASTALLPVLAPSPMTRGEPYERLAARTAFFCGSGFTLLVDNDEVYPIKESVRPIELPPGRATVQGSAEAETGATGGASRRERLRSSLK